MVRIYGMNAEIKGTRKQKTDQAVNLIKELNMRNDIEDNHVIADEILLVFAPPAVRKIFNGLEKWYS